MEPHRSERLAESLKNELDEILNYELNDPRLTTVNVTEPPPPPPPPPPPTVKRTLEEILAERVQDIYFDYDKNDIREDARNTLTRKIQELRIDEGKEAGKEADQGE